MPNPKVRLPRVSPDDRDAALIWDMRKTGCAVTPKKICMASVTRDEVLKLLGAHKAELKDRFGVIDLALFGFAVRDDVRPDSDIDILVSFSGAATSRRYFGVQFYLEDLFGRPLDLVTDKALRPDLRPYIEREAIHV